MNFFSKTISRNLEKNEGEKNKKKERKKGKKNEGD